MHSPRGDLSRSREVRVRYRSPRLEARHQHVHVLHREIELLINDALVRWGPVVDDLLAPALNHPSR
jgi:hypothetical protein